MERVRGRSASFVTWHIAPHPPLSPGYRGEGAGTVFRADYSYGHIKSGRSYPFPIPAFLCATARADDWAQWRGPQRDGHVPATAAIPTTLPAAPTVLWHEAAGFSLASPIVSGGRVFSLDNQDDKEVVHAADAGTGKEIWKAELDDASHDEQSQPGRAPRRSPMAIAFTPVLPGELQCLAATDGKLIWRTNYVKDFASIFIGEKGKATGASRHGHTATPLIDGEHLIAEVGGPGAGIVCFDKKSGDVVWKTQDDMTGYASPIVATVAGVRQAIAFTAIAVIGVDVSTGKLLWRMPIKTRLGRHATTPVVVGDIVVVSSHQAGLVGIHVAKDGDDFEAKTAWTSKESAINFASPVVVDHYLYGVGPNKNLMCVDVETGKQAWSKDDFFTTDRGKAYAGIIVMGKNLLVLADDGQLVMIAADPAEYRGYRKRRRAAAIGVILPMPTASFI